MIWIQEVEQSKTYEVFQKIHYAIAQNFDEQSSNPIVNNEYCEKHASQAESFSK